MLDALLVFRRLVASLVGGLVLVVGLVTGLGTSSRVGGLGTRLVTSLVVRLVEALAGRPRWAWLLRIISRTISRTGSARSSSHGTGRLPTCGRSACTHALTQEVRHGATQGVPRVVGALTTAPVGSARLIIVGCGLSGAQLAAEAL